jgi:hypothetical protein
MAASAPALWQCKVGIMTSNVIHQADVDIRRLTVDDLHLFCEIRAEALRMPVWHGLLR